MDESIYTTFESPLGRLLAVSDGHALTRLDMQGGRRPQAISAAWRPEASAFARLRDLLQPRKG